MQTHACTHTHRDRRIDGHTVASSICTFLDSHSIPILQARAALTDQFCTVSRPGNEAYLQGPKVTVYLLQKYNDSQTSLFRQLLTVSCLLRERTCCMSRVLHINCFLCKYYYEYENMKLGPHHRPCSLPCAPD